MAIKSGFSWPRFFNRIKQSGGIFFQYCQALFAGGSGFLSPTSIKDVSALSPAGTIEVRRAYLFDGSDDLITVSSADYNFERTDSFSFAFWVKADNTNTSNQILFAKQTPGSPFNGYSLCTNKSISGNDAGKLLIQFANTNFTNDLYVSTTNDTQINDGDWHHYALTYDGSSAASGLTLYEDGVSLSLSTGRDGLSASMQSSEVLAIGAGGNFVGNLPYDGYMDDFRIYDKELSVSEIGYLNSCGLTGADPTLSNLVGHWKMDDTNNSSAPDSSTNANDGTKVSIDTNTFHYEGDDVPCSSAVVTPDRVNQPGRCYHFDGTDDFVTTGNEFSTLLTGAFSVSVWFRSDIVGTLQDLLGNETGVSGNQGMSILWNTTNEVRFQVNDGGGNHDFTDTPALLANTWYHLTGTIDATNGISLYINGALSQNKALTSTVDYHVSGQPFVFGKSEATATTREWDGRIFDLRLYSKELSADEVAHIYSFGKSGTNPGAATLEGHWKCDDTSSTVSYDSSGNGIHGTKTNITAGTFLYEGSDVPYSFLNELGFTDDPTNGLIPRDESNIVKDVLGNDLEYSGRIQRSGKLIQSNCVLLDGVDDHILLSSKIILPVDGVATWSVYFRYYQDDDSGSMLFGTFNETSNRFYLLGGGNVITRVHLDNGEYFDLLFNPSTHIQEWVEGVFSYTGSTFTLTMNGVNYAYSAGSWAGATTSFEIDDIGNPYNNFAFAFPGNVCDFRVVLDGSEVLNLPIAEGADDIIYDTSGNNNHGVLTNGTLTNVWSRTQDLFHYNLISGHNRLLAFDKTNDFVSMDIGSFYADNDIITLTFNIHKLSSDLTMMITLGTDINNAFHIIDSSGSLRFDLNVATALRSRTVTFSPGIYTVKIDKNAADGSKLTITAPDASVYTDNVSSAGRGHRADGDLYIGKRPVLNDLFSDGLLSDIKLYDDSDVLTHSYEGYGGKASDWYDLVGEAHGVVSGSPATLYLPALSDGSASATGSPVLHPTGSFHNGAETKIDFTGGVAAPWTANSKTNTLVLDGTDDYITFPSAAGNFTDMFSFSGWIYSSAFVSQSRIIGKRDTVNVGWELLLNPSNYLTFYTGGTYTHPVALTDGKWEHVGFVINGASSKLFLNGEPVLTFSPTITSNSKLVHVGVIATTATAPFFEGAMLDFRIYDSALSDPHMKYLYSQGTFGKTPPSPFALWPFTSDLQDTSGNAYNGTAQGGAGIGESTILIPTAYCYGDPLSPGHVKNVDANGNEYEFLVNC